MDIDSVAKKIRQAVMDSAEDQGRTFNASILDDVIAKELRLHMPSPPPAPSNYHWSVVPLVTVSAGAKWSADEIRAIAHGISKHDEWR